MAKRRGLYFVFIVACLVWNTQGAPGEMNNHIDGALKSCYSCKNNNLDAACNHTQTCAEGQNVCISQFSFTEDDVWLTQACSRTTICLNSEENNADECYWDEPRMYGFEGKCTFCCTEDKCNTGIRSRTPIYADDINYDVAENDPRHDPQPRPGRTTQPKNRHTDPNNHRPGGTTKPNNPHPDRNTKPNNPRPGGTTRPNNSRPSGTTRPSNNRPDGNTKPNNPRPGGTTRPNNPRPGGTTKPNNTHPGGNTKPNNPRPGGTTRPNNSRPSGTTRPSNNRPDGNTKPNNPRPGGTTRPNNPRPGGTTKPNNTHPGGNTKPNNPRPGGTTRPNNPRPGGTTKPNNPHPGGNTKPNNPRPGGTSRPNNSRPGGTTKPNNSRPGGNTKPHNTRPPKPGGSSKTKKTSKEKTTKPATQPQASQPVATIPAYTQPPAQTVGTKTTPQTTHSAAQTQMPTQAPVGPGSSGNGGSNGGGSSGGNSGQSGSSGSNCHTHNGKVCCRNHAYGSRSIDVSVHVHIGRNQLMGGRSSGETFCNQCGAQKQATVELTTTSNTHLPTQFVMVSNTPSSSVTTMAHTAFSSTTGLTKHLPISTTDSVTIAPPAFKATTLLSQSTTDSVTIAPPMFTPTLKTSNLVVMTQPAPGTTSAPITFYAITRPTTQPSPTIATATTTSPSPAPTTLFAITQATPTTATSASPAPTTFFAITQPTTQQQTTTALRRCFSCQDPVCSTQVLKTCSADSLYCMSSVDQIVSGLRIFSKGCAKEDVCIKKYWGKTSGNTDCFLHIDDSPSGPSNMKMSCDFCCTTDGCNEHAVPNSNTLFIKS